MFPIVNPRLYQLPFWRAFDIGAQYSVLTMPRRSGKDVMSFSATVNKAIQEVGNYYYLFPTRAWAQRALWDNICKWAGGKRLVDLICPPEIVAKKNNSDFFIDLINGSRIKIDGTDNLNFVGQGGAGYVLSEFSLHKKEVTGFLAPILREAEAWVIFNGTLRGKANHLWKLYEDNMVRQGWYTQWNTLEHTKTDYWISDEDDISINPELVGLINPYTLRRFTNIQEEIDAGLISHSMARQEYLNDAVSQVFGSYYAYELRKMHDQARNRCYHSMGDHVYTFWDLGGQKETADTTAITFAAMNDCTGKVKVIDYYENSGRLRGHYFDILRQKGYSYGGHFVPHDSKRTNDWTGDSMIDTARKNHRVEMRAIPKTNSVADDIELVRRDFRNYSFNSEKCEQLLEHVTLYHENESTEKPCHRNNCSICHGASHGADSVRMMAVARSMGMVEPYLQTEKKIRLGRVYDDYTII